MSLQHTLSDLNNAYQNFFKKHGRHPKFKSKKKSKKNTTNGNIDTTNKEPENPEGTETPNN